MGIFFWGEVYIPHRGPTEPLGNCFVSMDLDPRSTPREEVVNDKNTASERMGGSKNKGRRLRTEGGENNVFVDEGSFGFKA